MRGRRHFLKATGGAALGLALAPLGRAAAAVPRLPDGTPDWRVVRDLYPLTRERVYLNTGGLGPASYPALDAAQRTTMELQRLSETGHGLFDEARAAVAAFLGAKPAEIAFVRNATEATSTVASGLVLRRGDEVIFESHAHPGGSFPWLNRQKLDGIKVKIFEPDPTSASGNVERIARLITPRTRVVQVSHVTAPTGIRMPVREIAALAREKDCWFHVDGAQAAGMIPVDIAGIGCDSYATSGHKWLGAPHGTGVLFVRESRLDEVRPTEVGAYSNGEETHLPDTFDYTPTAQRYEPGTRDVASVVGLAAAVGLMNTLGIERVAARAQALAQLLQQQLRDLPGVAVLTPASPALSGGITTIRTDGISNARLYAYLLDTHHLRCRIVNEVGLDALRISTHLFNSEEECSRVVEATRAALAGR